MSVGKGFIEVSLPVSIIKEGKYFVAYTPALDLSTSGETVEQAKEHFSEAVEIFFQELLDAGTLEEVLQDLGWIKIDEHWTPPEEVQHEVEKVKVPISA